jgi:hypothetical protein
MAARRTPASAISRSARWIVGASGVVIPVSRTRPRTRTPSEPITPMPLPLASSAD